MLNKALAKQLPSTIKRCRALVEWQYLNPLTSKWEPRERMVYDEVDLTCLETVLSLNPNVGTVVITYVQECH